MAFEWKKCALSDLGEIVGGATPSTKDESNYGGTIPWITPKDLSTLKGRFISYGERNITEKGLHSCSTQMMPANSVLFSSRAPIGYIAIAANPVCTNQGFKSIVVNDNNDPMFIYYLLKYNKDTIEAMGSGTTFKEVSGNTMRNVRVRVPVTKIDQLRVASVLSALDDKIELNNKINYNLLQLCLLQYRNLSSQNTPNGYIGDIIVESPKSKIKVGDAKGVSGAYPFFTSGQAILEYETNLVDGRNIYLNTGGNADVKYYIGPASYSTDTWCIHGVNELTDYLYLALLDMKDEIEQTCFDGSTLKHLQKQKLRDKPVYIPSEDDIHILATIKANLDLISHNQRENKKLANLRDALLPKLISGALDVSDVNI